MTASAPLPEAEPTVLDRVVPLAVEEKLSAPATALTAGETWGFLGALGALVILAAPTLGSDAWPFHPGEVEPTGPLAPLVRIAHGQWDPGVLRSGALLAGFVVAVYAAFAAHAFARRLGPLLALSATVLGLLVLPSVLLQAGLRDATAPWFYTNDSTYQIELAGDVIADAHSPYGRDYAEAGLERFYTLKGTVPRSGDTHVASQHFAYFPGSALLASVWRFLPSPWDDYRLVVALATLAMFFAVLLFRAPLPWRLVLGAALVANPLVIRAAWFGNADAPSILFLLLAFALVSRSRYTGGAVMLAIAVLFKQFALVAAPFLAVMIFTRAPRRIAWRAVAAFAAVLAAGLLPFVLADPAAFWSDTVAYGAETYSIVGYGLAGILIRSGVLDDRNGAYPFLLLALFIWAPVTLMLLRAQMRSYALWSGAAGFAASMFVLVFIGRAFHASYLLWPLAGIAAAALLAASAGFPWHGEGPQVSVRPRTSAKTASRRVLRRARPGGRAA